MNRLLKALQVGIGKKGPEQSSPLPPSVTVEKSSPSLPPKETLPKDIRSVIEDEVERSHSLVVYRVTDEQALALVGHLGRTQGKGVGWIRVFNSQLTGSYNYDFRDNTTAEITEKGVLNLLTELVARGVKAIILDLDMLLAMGEASGNYNLLRSIRALRQAGSANFVFYTKSSASGINPGAIHFLNDTVSLFL